jgi:pilus assembly protein CpaE
MMTEKNILIVDRDQVTVNWLEKILIDAGFTTQTAVTGKAALVAISINLPDIIILDPELPDMDRFEIIELIRKEPELANIFIIVLSGRDSAHDITDMLNKGVNDYIIKSPRAGVELLGKCNSYFVRQNLPERKVKKGRLIGFFSAKGGNGTSTLCVNMATAFAQIVLPEEVVVVDLVLPLGSLSSITGTSSTSSIAKIPYSFPKISLDEFITHSKVWGFSILGSSRTPGQARDVVPDLIDPLFEALLRSYPYVIVDLGKTLSRISLPLLRNTQSLVFVLGPDKVTLDLSQSVLNYLDELGVPNQRLFPIINRAVGREGLTKTEIEDKLKLPIVGTVPHASDIFTLACNKNKPYIKEYPNHVVTLVLKDLVKQLHEHVLKESKN